jgi:hypothetical protein
MAELSFEIWRDEAAGEQTMAQVSEQSDRVRLATMPNAALVHAFGAVFDFDAFQKNHDWNGWGMWRPEPHWTEQLFTDEEAAAQAIFISNRNGS